MRTYKIPALGLEIMANNIETSHVLAQYEFGPMGWRIPTKKEMEMILDLSDTLGILGLTKGLGKHYYWKDKGSEVVLRIKTMKDDWNSPQPQLRLVRDI